MPEPDIRLVVLGRVGLQESYELVERGRVAAEQESQHLLKIVRAKDAQVRRELERLRREARRRGRA